MKLLYGPISPFARKVLIVLAELGLSDRVTAEAQVVSPTEPNAAVFQQNPLGKIPVLVRDDGQALFDSRVIVEYLDALAGGGKLIPAGGEARWAALRTQAAADGFTEAVILMRYEVTLREDGERSRGWIEGQFRKIDQALAWLEANIDEDAWGVGEIAAFCGLDYFDFRFADRPWREGHPRLAAFFAKAARRPSVTALPAR
jgi:glutathione S-transferase